MGTTLESMSLNAFDNTATVHNSDLIADIKPYEAFDSRPFSWLQYNVDAAYSVHVGGMFSGTITTVASVPEPTTWAMMITGFGVIGSAMRRRTALPKAVVPVG